MQTRLSYLFKRHIQEIEGTTPDSKNLKSHPSGAKASVGCTTASEAKNTPEEKNTLGKDHSFLFNDTRFGETDDTYDSNTNKQQNDSFGK